MDQLPTMFSSSIFEMDTNPSDTAMRRGSPTAIRIQTMLPRGMKDLGIMATIK